MRKKKLSPLILITAILGIMTLGCIEQVQTYDVNPDRLSLGNTIIMNGVAFTVERYDLRDEFVGNHDLNIFYDQKGHKYLYVLVNAENVGNKPVEIPSQYDVKIMYQNRPYLSEVTYHSEEREMYEYNWLEEQPVQQHRVREGWILFQVPASMNASDVQIVVEFPHISYTQTAIWNLTT